MDSEIISSIIESSGMIIAAISGGLFATDKLGKIAKDLPLFSSYSEKTTDVGKLLAKAKKSITICVIVGNHLLRDYFDDICSCLERRVSVKFLLCDRDHSVEMLKYIGVDESSVDLTRKESFDYLNKLKELFPKYIEIREYDHIMTASYIGIDINQSFVISEEAMIQVMLYQPDTPAKNSTLAVLTRENAKVQFGRTACVIYKMWDAGKCIHDNTANET